MWLSPRFRPVCGKGGLLRRGCAKLMVIGLNTGHLDELVRAQGKKKIYVGMVLVSLWFFGLLEVIRVYF